MEYINIIIKSLFSGSSPNEWLIMKFIMALLGGLSVYIFKSYSDNTGETELKFWWKGFWFTIISSFGGVFIIGPQTAFNSYVAGLLGWSAISNILKQENIGASNEKYIEGALTTEQIKEMIAKGNNDD
jgi:hypothetical protein